MDTRPDVVSTYRMLRLALAAMAFAILLSAAVQTAVQGCVLTSISGYWYTRASTVFVACLVVIGVCLVALRGGTWTENLLLNLAGLFAPIVAIVPTSLTHESDIRCIATPPEGGVGWFAWVNPVTTGVVDNGLVVYFSVAALAFVVALVSSARRARLAPAVSGSGRLARVLGFVLAGGALVGLGAWRLVDGQAFLSYAHTTCAIAMFTCIMLVVAFRTTPLATVSRRWDGYRDDSVEEAMASERAAFFSMAYGLIAAVMALAVVSAFVVLASWDFRVILVETVLLVAFIVFWLLQTWQLGRVER